MVAGGIVIAVVMVLIVPVAVMVGGALWSAVLGGVLSSQSGTDES